MGEEQKKDMWESLLKLAVTEYSHRELEQYPSEEDMRKKTLPSDYDKNMRRWIKKYRTKTKILTVLRPMRKVAAVACIILGIGFAFLLQFEEVRAACQEVITQIYEKYIEFNYQNPEQEETGKLQVDYVPPGFFEKERTVGKLTTTIEYRTEQDEMIIITYSVEDFVLQIDNEHHYISEEVVEGQKATFFEEKEKGWNNYLEWKGEKGCFFIESTLSKDEMKKIAKNIK